MNIVIVVHGNTDLFQVAFALSPSGCFTSLLNGGKQECDEDGDDRDHHQKLNERKGSFVSKHGEAFEGGMIGREGSYENVCGLVVMFGCSETRQEFRPLEQAPINAESLDDFRYSLNELVFRIIKVGVHAEAIPPPSIQVPQTIRYE